jgi:prophage antirepressor-like protein
MENKLITVSGVTGYIDENGTAQLNTENCARGLGFTQEKNGVEYIRWERINGYISELGFSPLLGKAFIPENLLYRLVWKADSETAKLFQAKVADEILPAIRKTGIYAFKPMTQAELTAAIAQNQVEIEQKANAALETANRTSRQVVAALDVFTKPTSTDWQGDMNNRVRGMCLENGLSYLVTWGELFREVDKRGRVDIKGRQSRKRNRLKLVGVKGTQLKSVSELSIVAEDPKLQAIMEAIVREREAKYAVERFSEVS